MNEDSTAFASDHWLMRLHVWARRCAVVAAVLAVLAVAIDMRQESARSYQTALATVGPAPIPDYLAARLERPRYRHSVIAGGAFTGDELAAAMREDAVVADHHRGVDTERVRAIVTTRARTAYVSYRIGHRVYWTRKPVHIPAGETLLTDGVAEIRARCGNGVSDVARQPVSDVEPLAAELDEPIGSEDDSSITGERALVNTAPIGTPFVPFLQLTQNAVLGGDGAADLPEELRPVSRTPLAQLGLVLPPTGSAANNSTSLFDGIEPTARGIRSNQLVKGGSGFLVGSANAGGSGGGGNGGESGNGNPGGNGNAGSPGAGSDNDDNGNGNGKGGSNDNGNGGSTGGGSGNGNPGGNDGGGSPGGGSNNNGNGGSNGGGSQEPGGTIPTIYPGSEDLIETSDDVPAVPEPGTLALLGLGLAAAAVRRRRH